MKWTCLLMCALLVASTTGTADEEASNVPHITASQYGRCYAKSVPRTLYASEGTTKMYSVQVGDDVLLHTFAWYSPRLFLECNVGRPKQGVSASLVRFGSWPRGSKATSRELAIAFYYDGKLAKAYSTLDIAGSPDNVSASESHYTVFNRVDGYRWHESNLATFEVLASDGRLLIFDPTTGELVSAKKP